MTRKGGFLGLIVIFLILFSVYAQAIQPIQPIQDVEGLIRDEGQATRDFCRNEWNAKEISFKAEFETTANELEKAYKTILWLDRVITAILVIFGVFVANTLRRFLDKRADKRKDTIDYLELGEAPTPIKEYENEKNKEKKRN